MNDAIGVTREARDYECRSETGPDKTQPMTDLEPLIELDSAQWDAIAAAVPGGRQNIQDVYPLSPLQEGMLFHRLLNELRDAYVLSVLFELQSTAQVEALGRALQQVMDRHDVLRTAILWEGLAQPVQVVYRTATLQIHQRELQADRSTAAQLSDWMKPWHHTLNLGRAPLMQLQYAVEVQGRCYGVLQVHHLICDHQSLQAVVAEALAIVEGRQADLRQPAALRTYVAHALTQPDAEAAKTFFRSRLGDVDEPTAPFGLLDVHGDGSQVAEGVEELAATTAQRTKDLARRYGVSPARLFHAAWAAVVARTTGRDDVVFGTVLLAARQRMPRTQRTLGMLVNTLPLRLRLQGLTVAELVEYTHRELVELLSHGQTALTLAQRCSGIASNAPLFTALLNYRHSAPDPESGSDEARGIRVIARGEAYSNYPLAMIVDDTGGGFTLQAQTDRRLDPLRVIGYLRQGMQSLLDALEHAPQTPVWQLAILPQEERCKVVDLFNRTRREYPQHRPVHDVFETQVLRTPNAVAVLDGSRSLTYAQLNSRANRLARYLAREGVESGEYIPLLMRRSLEMVIVQLAVLKSGAAYVPIDPEFPAERKAFMIRDCGARRILADEALIAPELGQLHWTDCARALERAAHELDCDLALPLSSECPAYVMYTSGSTGLPKGVIVPHRGINRLAIDGGYAQISPDDCIAHYSNPAFDASTFEIWGALLNGARIAVVPQAAVLEATCFVEVLERASGHDAVHVGRAVQSISRLARGYVHAPALPVRRRRQPRAQRRAARAAHQPAAASRQRVRADGVHDLCDFVPDRGRRAGGDQHSYRPPDREHAGLHTGRPRPAGAHRRHGRGPSSAAPASHAGT